MSDHAIPLPYRRPTVVRWIVGLNIAVFIAWNFLPEWRGFMSYNFLVSWYHLQLGRFWVVLTSVFSHNLFFHLFINMFVLLSFGAPMEGLLGHRRFLAFYLIAGIVSSLAHAVISYTVLGTATQFALGASGAVAGLVLLFSLLFPRQKLLLFGIIPIPALWGALAFIAIDLWGLVAQAGGQGLPIGHGAHLGGAFTGIVYYFLLRRRIRRSRPLEAPEPPGDPR